MSSDRGIARIQEKAFAYLGWTGTVDGDPTHPIMIRQAQASQRFKDLHKIWGSDTLALRLKIQLFRWAVCSVLTHGYEAWRFDEANIKGLRLWNARRMAFITGKSIATSTSTLHST